MENDLVHIIWTIFSMMSPFLSFSTSELSFLCLLSQLFARSFAHKSGLWRSSRRASRVRFWIFSLFGFKGINAFFNSTTGAGKSRTSDTNAACRPLINKSLNHYEIRARRTRTQITLARNWSIMNIILSASTQSTRFTSRPALHCGRRALSPRAAFFLFFSFALVGIAVWLPFILLFLELKTKFENCIFQGCSRIFFRFGTFEIKCWWQLWHADDRLPIFVTKTPFSLKLALISKIFNMSPTWWNGHQNWVTKITLPLTSLVKT